MRGKPVQTRLWVCQSFWKTLVSLYWRCHITAETILQKNTQDLHFPVNFTKFYCSLELKVEKEPKRHRKHVAVWEASLIAMSHFTGFFFPEVQTNITQQSRCSLFLFPSFGLPSLIKCEICGHFNCESLLLSNNTFSHFPAV